MGNDITRRTVLGAAAAGMVTTLSGPVVAVAGDEKGEPKEGGLPSFRFPLEKQKPRVGHGCSAKEATVKDFPVSKNIAGVSMRLCPGGLRELHWHANAAEWGYVLKGRCRTTLLDPDGNRETDDFAPGDVWYFPRGHAHSIQGIGKEECHFILAFDNGAFSENATFSVSDWLAHAPKEVLAKNFGVPATTFDAFPKKEVYFAKGPVPPPLDEAPPSGSLRQCPLTHKYQLLAREARATAGGTLHLVSQKEFPISTTITGAIMTLKPRGLRELHWHPNADEWGYVMAGKIRITAFASGGRARTEEFGPGDVSYAPMGYGHYLENIGDTEARILIVFNGGDYQEISLSTWLASNPRQLVATNFGVPEDTIAKFPTKQVFIAAGK